MTALTLPLTATEARLVQTALQMLLADRRRAEQLAQHVDEACRERFLRAMAQDAADTKTILNRLDERLAIRRRFTDADAAGAELRRTLPDTPSTGAEAVDCTGVIKGNADIECVSGPYGHAQDGAQ